MPFFSIVIPTFNRADKIRDTLNSVLSQSYADFEVLVVDDGSADGAQLEQVVASYGDNRLKYFRQDNKGGSVARNTGVTISSGRYIAFLDSDDLFLPNKLQDDRRMLEDCLDSARVLFRQVLVNRGGQKQWIKPARGPFRLEDISEYLCCRGGFIQTSTIVLSRDFALRVPFSVGLPFGQDTDFAIRLAAAGAEFVMGRPLVLWNDVSDPKRVSMRSNYVPMLEWTESVRPLISNRAFLAYRGWHVARLAAPFDRRLAFDLYWKALRSGSFGFKIAIVALLQIAVPRSIYRNLADRVLSLFGASRI